MIDLFIDVMSSVVKTSVGLKCTACIPQYHQKLKKIHHILLFLMFLKFIFTSMCHGLAQALVFFAEISADNHDQIRFP